MGEAQATGFVRRSAHPSPLSHRKQNRISLLEAHPSANAIIIIRTAYIVMTLTIPAYVISSHFAHTTYELTPRLRTVTLIVHANLSLPHMLCNRRTYN